MQTTRLISTISYNTPSFLAGRLADLVKGGVIEYAHWIYHEPEKDELKGHFHLVLQPNKRLDTSALRNDFKEPTIESRGASAHGREPVETETSPATGAGDGVASLSCDAVSCAESGGGSAGSIGESFPRVANGLSALGVLPFQHSKMNDWLLYAVHDKAYLIQKGQSRARVYAFEDIQSTEPEMLAEQWKAAHEGENTRLRQVIEAAEKGVPWPDLLKLNIVPISQFFQYREIYFSFLKGETERAGRAGHEERPQVKLTKKGWENVD